jgi:hypothetical protein
MSLNKLHLSFQCVCAEVMRHNIKVLLQQIFYRPNMAVKGTFCRIAFVISFSSTVIMGFFYLWFWAKRPLLLRYASIYVTKQ